MNEPEIVKRGPGNPNFVKRAPEPAPELSSKQRAEARLREIREQATGDGLEERDRFWAPDPPDGWDYQWKRRALFNQEDPSYAVELQRKHWTPVPLDRHPAMMPPGWRGQTIEMDGMVLMERPMELTIEARIRDDRAARDAVRAKEMQLGAANKGDLSDRGRRDVKISKSYEPIPVPSDE